MRGKKRLRFHYREGSSTSYFVAANSLLCIVKSQDYDSMVIWALTFFNSLTQECQNLFHIDCWSKHSETYWRTFWPPPPPQEGGGTSRPLCEPLCTFKWPQKVITIKIAAQECSEDRLRTRREAVLKKQPLSHPNPNLGLKALYRASCFWAS